MQYVLVSQLWNTVKYILLAQLHNIIYSTFWYHCIPTLYTMFCYHTFVKHATLCMVHSGTHFCNILYSMFQSGPYLCTGPRGPGPGQQIFRGGILKKSRLKYGMREKKGCPRERNLREIYTENNVGIEFSRYDATGARRS